MGGTAAAALGLTQASGALDSTPGGATDVGRRVHEQPRSEREQPVRLVSGNVAATGAGRPGISGRSGGLGSVHWRSLSVPKSVYRRYAASRVERLVDPAGANFSVLDTTTQTPFQIDGTPYSGPVAGLQWEYIDDTSDNLSVTANVPNVFIHTGSGEDAIDVSHANGNNVLDGSTGSNFLVGGSGDDTFFVDDRSPSADIWSTVANFHAGDAATIFRHNSKRLHHDVGRWPGSDWIYRVDFTCHRSGCSYRIIDPCRL